LGDEIEWNDVGDACITYREKEGVYRGLVGKPEEKRPFGRPKHRLEYSINMDLEV